MEEFKLSKPLELPAIGDAPAKTIDVLKMDLESLTGSDVTYCVREAQAAKGERVLVMVTDVDFHIQMAARASKVDVELLKKLSARDYVGVATVVQAFLTGSV